MQDDKNDIKIFSSYKDITSEFYTPIIAQYLEIKKSYDDCLVFFRIGDFYEIFFEDAIKSSQLLGIVLTKKQCGNNTYAHMCGVPFHSADSYIQRLVKEGFKIAICEQLESPEEAKSRLGSKAIVSRDVVRVITKGTILEDSLLDKTSYNYLASIYIVKSIATVAWVDISTSDFYIEKLHMNDLPSFLFKIKPNEILVSDSIDDIDLDKLIPDICKNNISKIPNIKFARSSCLNILNDAYNSTQYALNALDNDEIVASGVLLSYILLTQKTVQDISFPIKNTDKSSIRMDLFTRKSLELTLGLNGERASSLKNTIDYTITSMGSRLLGLWVENPLTDVEKINSRLEVVEYFIENEDKRNSLRAVLKNLLDIERALNRISFLKGSIMDLAVIRDSLINIIDIKGLFFKQSMPKKLSDLVADIGYYNNLISLLKKALPDNINVSHKDGDFLKEGFNIEFDLSKNKRASIISDIKTLQDYYIELTGVSGLKIIYNNISGYSIEVSAKNSSSLAENAIFKHKQSLSNSTRFITEDLMNKQAEIAKLDNIIKILENEAFDFICKEVIKEKDKIQNTVKVIAQLDILSSFAHLAVKHNLNKPEITNSTALKIIGGRHIVVEKYLRANKNSVFVPNDCDMSSNKNIFLITGPNMSGKSTYLRQNAIIIIMAQMGCYIPAEYGYIGVVDSIFSRVGSADDLSKGQSTFMLEMLELAIILNNATNKSFIILDEIGRGTSTHDGLSIAWATLEYINNKINSRTLFATHYHELTKLEDKLSNIECYYVKIQEHQDSIIFMHNILKGYISRSYGIDVAKIAGVPKWVLKRASDILKNLEAEKTDNKIDLFTYQESKEEKNIINPHQELIDYLHNIDENNITPKEALNIIFNIKDKIKDKNEV